MATRLAARYVSRRFSNGGNILGEQEKTHAENVLSKKTEPEKLGMLARKGTQNAEATSESSGSRGYAKTRGSTAEAPTEKKKKKKKKINYAVVVDAVAFLGSLGGYLVPRKTKGTA